MTEHSGDSVRDTERADQSDAIRVVRHAIEADTCIWCETSVYSHTIDEYRACLTSQLIGEDKQGILWRYVHGDLVVEP